MRASATWYKTARYLRATIASFDRTTVVSQLELECLADAGIDVGRVAVVANGVDDANLQHRVLERDNRIVFNGSLTYGPNLDAMRFFVGEVLPLVRRAHPRVRLWITGACGDAAEQFAGRDDVVLTGHVGDIASVVAQSRVCVAPLRMGGGTRLKILEAMSLETPVVATTKGAEGLAVSHESNILLADDPAGLASAIGTVLSNDGLASTIGRNGRSLVASRYTWTHSGTALAQVLDGAHRAFLERQPSRGAA